MRTMLYLSAGIVAMSAIWAALSGVSWAPGVLFLLAGLLTYLAPAKREEAP